MRYWDRVVAQGGAYAGFGGWFYEIYHIYCKIPIRVILFKAVSSGAAVIAIAVWGSI
jgi:hypothetical protein